MNQKTSNEFELQWNYVDSEDSLHNAVEKLSKGFGPVGVDVERASSYKYSQQAYLIQIYREGSGTFLFDPLALDTLSPLAEAILDTEWIIHAAHSDLDSLEQAGLVPNKIFDTELASRLLGFERVGLGSIAESLLDVPLEKAFSRADWSQRPLPEPWLEYAALDVVFLPKLRERTKELLLESDKYLFATQEFEALLESSKKEPPAEPWRKIPGFGKLKDPKKQNIAKELWLAREHFAEKFDIAPTRALPNKAIIAAALMNPRSAKILAKNRDFTGKYSRKEMDRWWNAITKAKIQSFVDLPSLQKRTVQSPDSPPKNIKIWEKKNPEALARLQAVRQLLQIESERLNIPPENILTPKFLRHLSWNPPETISEKSVSESLSLLGAREWQRSLTAHKIAQSFVDLL